MLKLADIGETNYIALLTKWKLEEDELKEVGQKQQNLEVGEEKALEREEVLQSQIKELMTKLTNANVRSENAEMDIGRLNVRIDKVEEDLVVSDLLEEEFLRALSTAGADRL